MQAVMEKVHIPVMVKEVLQYLEPSNKKIIVDCTVGLGGHAKSILPYTSSDAIYVGIDKDKDSLNVAAQNLKPFNGKVVLYHGDFRNLDRILYNLNIKEVDAFLFDLGISSFQLNDHQRGFSFSQDGPLDMRMDKNAFLCAYDLVNNLSEKELFIMIKRFGEERFAKRIAHSIIEKRKKSPIYTTSQLKEIILDAVPYSFHHKYHIHPATRVFQALRIAVNRELDSLASGITKALEYLRLQGRIAVISFHSLEDRIVKHTFKDFSSKGIINILTKKPILPQLSEIAENSRCRSAKLRAAEKINL